MGKVSSASVQLSEDLKYTWNLDGAPVYILTGVLSIGSFFGRN
jgi:hypothetical protein